MKINPLLKRLHATWLRKASYALIVVCFANVVLAASAAMACDTADKHPGRSFISYGQGVASMMTKRARRGPYRVFVVYANGTDMLFMDKLSPTTDVVALTPTDGMPFVEFNFYEASNLIESIHCEKAGPQTVDIAGTAIGLYADQKFGFAIEVDTATQCYTYQDSRNE